MRKKRWGKIKYEYAIWLIALIAFVQMMWAAGNQSLWMDDIAQIDIAWQDSLKEMIGRNIVLDNNPPLSHLLCYFWIRLVPYGTAWLKLFNIIWITLGIVLCGKCGLRYWGNITGVFAAVFIATDLGIITLAAYTFRPYGMLFTLSALALYLYLDMETAVTKKKLFCYTAVLICLAYTHYFAILLCVVLGIFDIYKILRKKKERKAFLPYIIAAVSCIPWFILILKSSIDRIQNFWPARPDLKAVWDMAKELMGYDVRLTSFCMAAFVAAVGYSLFVVFRKQGEKEKGKYLFLLNSCVVFVIGSVYLVSRYSSVISSLFVARYFLCVMPMLVLAIGYMIQLVIEAVVDQYQRGVWKWAVYGFFTLACLGIFTMGIVRNQIPSPSAQPFEEVADYLQSQNDVRDENVLIFNTCNELQNGWDYYLTHKGQRETLQVVWTDLKGVDLEKYDKIYVAQLHLPFTEEMEDIILENGFTLQVQGKENLPISIYQR